jgi:phosphoglycolate phosphatase
LRNRHIIWDWNGTLLDDLDVCIEVINGMLAPRGLPLLDRERYHERFDFPVRDYYSRLGFDFAKESFERLSVEFISAYDARRWDCRLHGGASEVLSAVTRGGATQSILSAYRHETLVEIVAHFGLEHHFVRLTGLDNIFAHSKAELGRAWIAELGLPPADVLMVGDTLHDLDVARHMGVECILVASGHHPAARLRASHNCVVDNLAAVQRLLGL